MNDMNPTMDKNATANSHLIQSMLVAASFSIRIHRMESNFKSNPCHIGHRMIHWLGIVDHPTSHISASLVGRLQNSGFAKPSREKIQLGIPSEPRIQNASKLSGESIGKNHSG